MANNNPTFGELLRSLNNDLLKYKIRNIKKLDKKIVNIKNGIGFTETHVYVNMRIHTIYTYVTVINMGQ